MTDVYKKVVDMIDDNWSSTINKPLIGLVTEYRWLDVANMEYVLVGSVIQNYSFLGLGAEDYRDDLQISILVKTSESRERSIELLEEVLRIMKTKEHWSPLINVYVDNIVDLSSAERKIWSFDIIIKAMLLERLG